MKTAAHSPKPIANSFRAVRIGWLPAAVLAFFAVAPGVWTQEPPPGVLVGTTHAASLRNAGAATRDQAAAVRVTANTCARNASSANYRIDLFMADFNTLKLQFHTLRERFNWLAYLALQSNHSQAHNAVAELDAGLNIISELFVFLDQRFAEGTLDRATHVRTCRTLEDVMGQWERELRKHRGWLGFF